MSRSPETVAVLGAGGVMGASMSRNLLRAGIPVRAWNRTRERALPLRAAGATLHDSPAQTADGASVLLTMLSDADAVSEALEAPHGALSAERPPAAWAQMATIGDAGTGRCAELAGRHGIAFVDAPVLGTRGPAEEGRLVVMASGPDEEWIRERLRPIFDAVAQKTMWLGGAGSGTRLKLVANAWLLSVVEGCAEAIALAEGLDLDPALLLEAVEGGPLDLPYLRMKAGAIVARDFEPSFRLALAAKDAGLVQDAALASGLDLPLLSAIRARLAEAAREHGDEDVIATYRMSAPTSAAGSR